MWPKLALAVALCVQGALSDDCAYTVSVLDVAGVQCVPSPPCSGTYYASGLSQGVGACPSGTSCALKPETPIMNCAVAGRPDLIYVNADGTLTKGGRSVNLSGDSIDSTSTSSNSKSNGSTSKDSGSTTSNSKDSGSTTSNSKGSGSTSSNSKGSGSTSNSKGSGSTSNSKGSSSNSNAASSSSDGGSDANVTSNSTDASQEATNSSTSGSWESDSGSSVISPGSSSANQQAEFNPGSILSDDAGSSKSKSDGDLDLGSIIGIVVGCLAVVAIAAGMRLLKKGKDAELETPEGAAVDGYGGGGGMTPKENVLLL